jgi:serine/threonine protein kinase
MNAHLHEEPLPPTALQPAIPQELEDIILKAIGKDPDKRFQSAHEFRKALLKVGMVHVRAYRRLKAIRREKDKVALSLSPTWRREEEEAPSLMERLRSRLDEVLEKKTSITAVVAVVAVLSLATTLWLRPAKELPAPVAQTGAQSPATTPTDQPTLADSTTAPVSAPVVASTLPVNSPASVPGTHMEKTGAPAINGAAPAKAESTRKPTVNRPRQNAGKTEPKNPAEDQKYDALKKAWGG